MPEDANVILNEFYDIKESKEQVEQLIASIENIKGVKEIVNYTILKEE